MQPQQPSPRQEMGSAAPPQFSPDGRWWWDGSQWIPAPMPQMPPATTSSTLVRQFSADGRFWWDGQRWLPYRRVTWNSLHLHGNPPEDKARLARNLGIWAFALGTIGFLFGAVSILGFIGGIAGLFHAVGFFQANSRYGGRLPGVDKAIAGLVLSSAGILELAGAVALHFA